MSSINTLLFIIHIKNHLVLSEAVSGATHPTSQRTMPGSSVIICDLPRHSMTVSEAS